MQKWDKYRSPTPCSSSSQGPALWSGRKLEPGIGKNHPGIPSYCGEPWTLYFSSPQTFHGCAPPIPVCTNPARAGAGSRATAGGGARAELGANRGWVVITSCTPWGWPGPCHPCPQTFLHAPHSLGTAALPALGGGLWCPRAALGPCPHPLRAHHPG